MKILGISAYHQDSSAALLVDGIPVAAVQEGLHTKIPLDPALPLRAAQECLGRARVPACDLDAIVFYERPLRRFERTLAYSLRQFPSGGRAFAHEVSQWLGERLWTKGRLVDEFDVDPGRVHFVDHLDSHAACAFYQSPFEQAAVLVVDDAGEWATAGIYRASGSGIERLQELHLPHSLGLVSSAMTKFLGFEPGRDDGFLEALATRGTPRYRDQLMEVIGTAADGSPWIDPSFFQLGTKQQEPWKPALEELIGPARAPGDPLCITGGDTRHADLSASLQAVLELRLSDLARGACEAAGEPDLCFGGMLAGNRGVCRALLASGPGRLFVPPEPGDAGAALGAAWKVHQRLDDRRPPAGSPRRFLGAPLVPGGAGHPPEHPPSGLELVPSLLEGQPVGWARGPLEFASTCLRSRLALIDPRVSDAPTILMRALQRSATTELCRLVLPSESLERYVQLPQHGLPLARQGQLRLQATDALKDAHPELLPPDGMLWVQAVEQAGDPALHQLLLAVAARGAAPSVPGLLACDLHLQGGVLPRGAAENMDLFARSGLGALLLEDRLLPSQGAQAS